MISWFQAFAFKCNLFRYTAALHALLNEIAPKKALKVGRVRALTHSLKPPDFSLKPPGFSLKPPGVNP